MHDVQGGIPDTWDGLFSVECSPCMAIRVHLYGADSSKVALSYSTRWVSSVNGNTALTWTEVVYIIAA